MKKICIVTVYNSENCGSFLQAYALKKKIESLGYDVYFYKRNTKGTSLSLCETLKFVLKKILKGNFVAGINQLKKHIFFKQNSKQFRTIDKNSTEFNNISCFVIGSDTIWNFDNKSFYNNRKVYTGELFPKKKITYAASAGNTNINTFTDNKDIIKSLNKLDCISVRDDYTKKIIDKVLNKDVEIVVDPTLLLTKEDFIKIENNHNDKDFILIYFFGKIPEKTKNDIISLSKKYNKKIFSFGESLSWCDKSIIYNPYDLLYYFHNADFIITNTFHGTIFSIIYEKKFADYGLGKKKVEDLLEKFELKKQLVTKDNLYNLYNDNIDYKRVKRTIKKYSELSTEYLIRELGDTNEK